MGLGFNGSATRQLGSLRQFASAVERVRNAYVAGPQLYSQTISTTHNALQLADSLRLFASTDNVFSQEMLAMRRFVINQEASQVLRAIANGSLRGQAARNATHNLIINSQAHTGTVSQRTAAARRLFVLMNNAEIFARNHDTRFNLFFNEISRLLDQYHLPDTRLLQLSVQFNSQ